MKEEERIVKEQEAFKLYAIGTALDKYCISNNKKLEKPQQNPPKTRLGYKFCRDIIVNQNEK